MGSWTVLEPAPELVLHIAATDTGICRVSFLESTLDFLATLPGVSVEWERDTHPLLAETTSQLREYFAGRRRQFQLPLDLRGTSFQEEVWKALLEIPYGRTLSYAQLARNIARPKAIRAVGAANGANPVPIIVPCHRVVASGGALGGYGGGLALKKRLLALESGESQSLFDKL
jgi:O-6-methylguanine DNA methyltransferase